MKDELFKDELIKLINRMEANEIFDKDSFTEEDKNMLNVLKSWSVIKAVKDPLKLPKKTACATGHRPDKGLPKRYNYNYTSKAYAELKSILKQQLFEDKITDAWTGMAHGVDLIFAQAVLELRNVGYPIKLHCAIPCKNHNSKMFGPSLKFYNEIIRQADQVVFVSDKEYSAFLMQKRNEYMVDNSNIVYAVCDLDFIEKNEHSGTKNCIKYALSKNVDIKYINPDTFDIKNETPDFLK